MEEGEGTEGCRVKRLRPLREQRAGEDVAKVLVEAGGAQRDTNLDWGRVVAPSDESTYQLILC